METKELTDSLTFYKQRYYTEFILKKWQFCSEFSNFLKILDLIPTLTAFVNLKLHAACLRPGTRPVLVTYISNSFELYLIRIFSCLVYDKENIFYQ
jgi:hypothetical protein